jgi:hypothetical protein
MTKPSDTKPSDVSWPGFAAAPAFAVMAVLTMFSGDAGSLCAPAHAGAALTGMGPMYLLMAACHLGPWLRLLNVSLSSPPSPG